MPQPAWFLSEVLPVPAALALAFVYGLVLGSFLNVVIARLPGMIAAAAAREGAGLAGAAPLAGPRAPTLISPRSHCPACGHRLPWRENIPLLSYLLLRGRCSACAARISPRYPGVELISGLAALAAVAAFGWSPAALAAALLLLALIAVAVIDAEHGLVPDAVVLPMLWLGLAASLTGYSITPSEAVLGAILGYATLWAIARGYGVLAGKEAMGRGDFKLAAMLGAWLGPGAVLLVLWTAFLIGALATVPALLSRRRRWAEAVPFAPALAAAAALVIFLEPEIMTLLRALLWRAG